MGFSSQPKQWYLLVFEVLEEAPPDQRRHDAHQRRQPAERGRNLALAAAWAAELESRTEEVTCLKVEVRQSTADCFRAATEVQAGRALLRSHRKDMSAAAIAQLWTKWDGQSRILELQDAVGEEQQSSTIQSPGGRRYHPLNKLMDFVRRTFGLLLGIQHHRGPTLGELAQACCRVTAGAGCRSV